MPSVEITIFERLLQGLAHNIELKLAIGGLLGVLTFFFDAVYFDALIAIVVLIIFDFLTAIAATKINGHQIQSAKVFRSAVKTCVYFLLISAGHLAETTTNHVLPIIDETVMGFLGLTELISIMENVGLMGFAVPLKLLNQLNRLKNKT
jgi:toxin secretion/phage lysis holin